MFEVIAQGQDDRQRVRKVLTPGRSYTVGRGADCDLVVPWDKQISRTHVRLTAAPDGVEVQRLPAAANPVFFQGQEARECHVASGSHFVVGSTSFHILTARGDHASPSRQPLEEVTFNRQQLEKVRFHDAEKQIEVLTHLPEVIWGARTDTDLFHRLVNLMLAGVARAEAVAILKLKRESAVDVLHWDRRRETAGEFRPSGRLVREAIHRGSSVLHVWQAAAHTSHEYTETAEFDWAYCTPVTVRGSESWGIYVAGRFDRPFAKGATSLADGVHLQSDVKFTELVAEIISAVRRLNSLQRQQAGLRQFFAPPILAALGDDLDTELLAPRECHVTVMFCDLRGFSHQAEELSDDLTGLLDRVSRALGVMTRSIHQFGGVTGDFQGDAALGFWGWPFASDDAVLDACRAALGIRQSFAETFGEEGHPLANFKMGIGIAHGRAVAGKIGTAEQVKVTVFGPVVNLASRLESMTSQLRVPILLDEATAAIARQKLPPSEGRTRRLAKVLPAGMETPVLVSELLPPESAWPELTDAHLRMYEQGVEHFVAGRWDEAYRCLHDMPPGDHAQDFLTMLITQHKRTAPPDWDGIVRLANK